MSGDKLCVILLNHGNWADTVECLESLCRTLHDQLAVVVVDTGSANDSVARLVDWAESGLDARPATAAWGALPARAVRRPAAVTVTAAGQAATALPPFDRRLTIVTCDRPLGFAAGCNVGLRACLDDPEARWVWLLNNDAIAAPQAAGRLVERATASAAGLGALGTLIADYRQPERIQILGGGQVAQRSAEVRFPAHGRPTSEAPALAAELGEPDYISGASLFTSVAVARRVGPLDEAMHLYWEDTDWCARMRAAGLRLGVCPQAIVWHKGQASTGGINHYTKYHHFRSAVVYMRRHRRRWLAPLAVRLAKSVARDLAAARPRDAAACVRGLAAGLRLGPPAPPAAFAGAIGDGG